MKLNKKLMKNCKHPYYLKGDELYVHPDDAPRFWEDRRFLSVVCFPSYRVIKNSLLGSIVGLEIFLQDDMQVLLLAMNGGISVEDDSSPLS